MLEPRQRVTLSVGDITTLDLDAIVNAANTGLARGGGVCGAIFRAAGRELDAACAAVAPCPTGDARITPGFGLPARWIVHAVGPVWRGGAHAEERLLASAYRASLDLAAAHDLHSIAFPSISTGIYGFPIECAAPIAVEAVTSWLANTGTLDIVHFRVFSDADAAIYGKLLAP